MTITPTKKKFNFDGDFITDFPGYNSAFDKTRLAPGFLIRGSKNVYKKISGTIATRPGVKRRGSIDSTDAGTKASYEWTTNLGLERPLRVNNNKLQVESDIVTSGTYVWYDLKETSSLASPAATLTRFVFDTWWDNDEKADRLLMVRGDDNILHWSGGLAKLAYAGNAAAISLVGGASLSSFTLSSTDSDMEVDTNGLTTTNMEGAIALTANPNPGDQLRLVINGFNHDITFVNTLVGQADVIIGSTAAETRANLLGLLQAPSTSSSTHNGFGTTEAQTRIGYITYASTNALIKSGDESWAELNFAQNLSAEKKVVINSTEYTYTGGEGSTILTGVTGDPTGEAADSVVIQSVMVGTDKPIDNYKADFLKVINNQAWVGSYSSRIVYISCDVTTGGTLGFLNYTNAAALVVGDPDAIILDSPCKGIGIREGKVFIFSGDADLVVVTPNFDLPISQAAIPVTGGTSRNVIQKVEKKRLAGLTAAIGHEFIDNLGEYIVWLDQKNRVRAVGNFANVSSIKPVNLSLDVQVELREDDFTGGHLRVVSDDDGDTIYITAPNNSRVWMYQIRETQNRNGEVETERLWQPPQILGLQRIAVIGGDIFGHSNVNPQLYQIWNTGQWFDDSPSDEPIPYTCVARFAYNNHGSRWKMKSFGFVAVEGYLPQGLELNANVYIEYQGSVALLNTNINSVNEEAKFYSGFLFPSFGDSSFGDNPFGDGILTESNDQELMPKFRALADVGLVNCFEYSLEFYTMEADARWELLGIGTNARAATQTPIHLRK